jgi:hypothetical protein
MKTTKLISLSVCLLTCAGCQHNMVELETDLPPAKLDRTQKPRRKQGEPFLVPQGTKLLSRGVKVTSGDMEPVLGELEMITDGNKEARDGWFYFVELMPGLQWVQLDLGKPYALYAILVWHCYSPRPADYLDGQVPDEDRPTVYQDVVVQISNDPAFKKDVTTVFNNDHDNSSGLGKGKDDTYLETSEGRWINPKGVEGRYVRLYSQGYSCLFQGKPSGGSELNRYIEVEVYGK